MQFFAALSALAACVSAYQVLTPAANSTITKGSNIDVAYSTVDTDPSTFSVYLTNFVQWPPMVLSLVQDVSKGSGSVSVRIPCSVNSGSGFTLNFVNGTNTYVIYAQSPAFSLSGDCSDPAPVSSAIYSNTSTATVVQTVQTIVIPTPVLWFVQPSNLVAAAAICPPGSPSTVTVTAAGADVTAAAATVTVTVATSETAAVTSTVTVASCPSQGAILAALAAAQGVGSVGAVSAAPQVTVSASVSGTVAKASGTVAAAGNSVAPAPTKMPAVTTMPTSTSGTTKVGGATLGLVAVFAIIFL